MMNEIADLPLHGFRKSQGKKHPDTLEKGGKGKTPAMPEPEPPKQTPKAPNTNVYRERAQQAGRGGMSAGYQSTLLTGVGGVSNESIYGPAAASTQAMMRNNTLGS